MKKELLLIYNLTIQEQNGKRLNQFHFWMPEGELVHILGISNAGKTTLYRYLAGELASKSGLVRYQGIEYSAGKLFDGFKNLICSSVIFRSPQIYFENSNSKKYL